MQMDPLWDLREAHTEKKKVVSSAGWITEPGSTAGGAEVPAVSPIPSVTLGGSLIRHPESFRYETRASAPSLTARPPGLAHQALIPAVPAACRGEGRGCSGAHGKNAGLSLSSPWHRDPPDAQPLPSHSPQDQGGPSGESLGPRAGYCSPEAVAPRAGAGQWTPRCAV